MRGEYVFTQLRWVASRLAVTCLSTINPVNARQCKARDTVATKDVPREKNMDLKSMLENINEIVTGLTKRCVDMRTE